MAPDPSPSSGPRDRPHALSADEIERALAGLPRWSVAATTLPGEGGGPRREMTRSFRFHSFADAMGFMHDAVPLIDALNHHPRWENVFKRVTVWLSTWDAGHVPTALDVELARTLDALFQSRAGIAPQS